MKTLLKIVSAIALLAVAAAQSIACNTVEGMGEDVEAGGEAIQDAAE